MKRIACTFFVLFASSTLGCGMLMPQQPGAGAPQQNQATYTVPKESQDAVRKQEAAAHSAVDDAEDEQLDKMEKDSLKAPRVALGKEAAWQGGQPGESSSSALIAIKKAKMKVRLEPVTDGEGKAVNDDFFQLKDSFTDRDER